MEILLDRDSVLCFIVQASIGVKPWFRVKGVITVWGLGALVAGGYIKGLEVRNLICR